VSEIVAGVRDGSIDLGIVRCPPVCPGAETRVIRHEAQGVLLRRDHRLASAESVSARDLEDEQLLLHPREANPGHYDAIVELCRAAGFEPSIALRRLSFDLAYSPVANGEAVAIIGESSRTGLPAELCWLPLSPPAALEVALLARRHNRSPAVDRMLGAATEISRGLGWL
jgi:DNA-binding transcriptional LysR family regulator